MNKSEFLAIIKDTLSIRREINENTILMEIPEWDSLGIIVVASLLSQYKSTPVLATDLEQCKTINDLISKVEE